MLQTTGKEAVVRSLSTYNCAILDHSYQYLSFFH